MIFIYMDITKLTSVKILNELYEKFKDEESEMTLQKLVNRSIHLYLNDEEFAKQLHTHTDLTISGSGL